MLHKCRVRIARQLYGTTYTSSVWIRQLSQIILPSNAAVSDCIINSEAAPTAMFSRNSNVKLSYLYNSFRNSSTPWPGRGSKIVPVNELHLEPLPQVTKDASFYIETKHALHRFLCPLTRR